MAGKLGVYHDVDGCAFVGHDGRIVYRSTFYCRYNDAVSTPAVLDSLLRHGVLGKDVVSMFEVNFGEIRTPADIVRLGEYARFAPKIRASGKNIEKEALAEIERRATEKLSREAFYQSLREAQLTPGLEYFARWVKSKDGRQIIVTDDWDLVGSELAGRIGADQVIGAAPVFENGRFTGKVYNIGQKKPIMDDILRLMGLTYENSIGIDDANSVVTEFGLPIAFCPTNPELRKHPGIVVVEEPHYRHVQTAAEKWFSEKKLTHVT
ncbi:MAG: haloacid dehalogenase-like hydrolase [Candidatus Aenigmarchaeota archaeon]|nr:haloacid dehalogenase-like hydrolase [Candidatus Aenigmarchaeota archaeon]